MQLRFPFGLLVLAACTATTEGPHLYATSDLAPGYTAASVEGLEHLGPSLVEKGVNFGVYSEHAERIEVLLFDDPESTRPTRQFPLKRFGNVWNLFVDGIGVGQHYGYIAWGPNWPYDPAWEPGSSKGFIADVDTKGNRFDPNKLLFDPYGKAIHREHDWSKGSIATGPARHVSTWAAASKSVVVQSKYAWSANEATWRANRQKAQNPGHDWQDLVMYEVHVKGFTMDPASGVDHPGTYRGFGEKASYFKDMGINAVELLPVHEKPLDGGYWGYMNTSFFAPELSYAFKRGPLDVLDEFKEMVDRLHQQGVEVVIDVVYNHHGEGGLWRQKRELGGGSMDPDLQNQMVNLDPEETAGLYNLRGLDNATYYALSADNRGYWNNTGVGQQSRANHPAMQRLILDSLRYYAEELHVDGFRFDLAPVLGERDGDFNNWDAVENTVLQKIIDDPVLQKYNTRIIAEPWAAGGSDPYKVGKFPAAKDKPGTAWGEWNGRYRDWWRAFMNDDNWKLNSKEGDADGGFELTGSSKYFEWNGRRPYHCVNFVTVHDGFTMYDVFTYATKQNGCGPLNPSCCDGDRLTAWCDPNSGESNNRSREWGGGAEGEGMKRQLMRNLFTAMMISHGTPLLLGGDEWMRTQIGNNNAYSSKADNDANWYQWGAWQQKPEKVRMHDFVSKIANFRNTHRYAFAPATYGGGAPFSWKSERNDAGVDWGSRHVMLHYYDGNAGPELAILINLERTQVNFTLPTGRTWTRVVDTQGWYDSAAFFDQSGKDTSKSANAEPEAITSAQYGVPGSTIVILEAAK